MATRRWADLKKKAFSQERLVRIDQRVENELLEMNLRSLRELLGKTQEELARAAEMSQSELSRTERREDHLISTLRRYVEALGGKIEVTANFGDRQIRLSGV